MTLRDTIAERVKNAYAAGYNDARCDRLDRMDEVADAETARILGLVGEVLLSEDGIRWAASASADAMADMIEAHIMMVGEDALRTVFNTAFGPAK